MMGPRAASDMQAPAPKPNVLLITLDTVRADRMGFLGSTRGLTPQLDALARTATVFTRAYSQAPITTVSHATILTGTYPPLHRVSDFGAPLPTTVPYLPVLLHDAGYRTAAFVGSLILDPHAGTAPGFDRGFDVYDAGFHLRRPGDDRYQSVERRGEQVVTRALAWLNGRKPIDQPKQPPQPTQQDSARPGLQARAAHSCTRGRACARCRAAFRPSPAQSRCRTRRRCRS